MFGKKKINRKKGVWICYWNNGNPRVMISHKENRIEGPLKIYYESGEIMFSGTAEKGENEIRLKKFMKYGKEIKTTTWSLETLKEVIPSYFIQTAV